MTNFPLLAWLVLGGVAVALGLFWYRDHRIIKSALASGPIPVMTDDDRPAIPIDPNDPPRTLIYNPKDGVSKVHCSCHNRMLAVGESVLFWPQPDGAVLVFCEDFKE